MPKQYDHWSDAAIAQMKLLIADHSYGMAASIMGYPFTRNSLIGKAKRLGLTTPKGEKRSYPRHHAQTCPVTSNKSRKPKKPARPFVADEPIPLGPLSAFPPTGTCQYTPHDIMHGDWQMCGNPGFPWCDFHHRVLHQQQPVEVTDEESLAA